MWPSRPHHSSPRASQSLDMEVRPPPRLGQSPLSHQLTTDESVSPATTVGAAGSAEHSSWHVYLWALTSGTCFSHCFGGGLLPSNSVIDTQGRTPVNFHRQKWNSLKHRMMVQCNISLKQRRKTAAKSLTFPRQKFIFLTPSTMLRTWGVRRMFLRNKSLVSCHCTWQPTVHKDLWVMCSSLGKR